MTAYIKRKLSPNGSLFSGRECWHVLIEKSWLLLLFVIFIGILYLLLKKLIAQDCEIAVVNVIPYFKSHFPVANSTTLKKSFEPCSHTHAYTLNKHPLCSSHPPFDTVFLHGLQLSQMCSQECVHMNEGDPLTTRERSDPRSVSVSHSSALNVMCPLRRGWGQSVSEYKHSLFW